MQKNVDVKIFQFFKKQSDINYNGINKNLESQVNSYQIDIPYNTIALIYPFYKKQQKSIKNIDKDLAKWEDDSLVNINTRFYSYIIKKFGTENSRDSKTALCKKCSEIENNLLIDAFKVSKWKTAEDKKTFSLNTQRNPLSIKFDCLRLYIFDSSIVFLCVFFTIDTVKENLAFTEFQFKEFITNLKQVINKTAFKEFIDSCIKPIKPVSFFEYKTTKINNSSTRDNLTTTTQSQKHAVSDNDTSQTLRATFFSNICLRSNSDVQTNIIPAWLIGVEFFNLRKGVELLNKRVRASLVEGNVIDASAEGASSLTIVGKDERFNPEKSKIKALANNAEMRCQHVFLNYIMVLHQFYFLHLITMNAANLMTHNKKKRVCLYDIEEIENQYTHFRNSYMYQRVTAVEKYQDVYECMQKNMHIVEFSEEARYTVQPMRELVEKRRMRTTNIVMAGFTAATFTNVAFNVANRLHECISIAESKFDLLMASGFFLVALMVVYLIYPGPFGRLIHNTIRKLKQKFSSRKK